MTLSKADKAMQNNSNKCSCLRPGSDAVKGRQGYARLCKQVRILACQTVKLSNAERAMQDAVLLRSCLRTHCAQTAGTLGHCARCGAHTCWHLPIYQSQEVLLVTRAMFSAMLCHSLVTHAAPLPAALPRLNEHVTA